MALFTAAGPRFRRWGRTLVALRSLCPRRSRRADLIENPGFRNRRPGRPGGRAGYPACTDAVSYVSIGRVAIRTPLGRALGPRVGTRTTGYTGPKLRRKGTDWHDVKPTGHGNSRRRTPERRPFTGGGGRINIPHGRNSGISVAREGWSERGLERSCVLAQEFGFGERSGVQRRTGLRAAAASSSRPTGVV